MHLCLHPAPASWHPLSSAVAPPGCSLPEAANGRAVCLLHGQPVLLRAHTGQMTVVISPSLWWEWRPPGASPPVWTVGETRILPCCWGHVEDRGSGPACNCPHSTGLLTGAQKHLGHQICVVANSVTSQHNARTPAGMREESDTGRTSVLSQAGAWCQKQLHNLCVRCKMKYRC